MGDEKTKKQLVQELHDCGEVWADESYSKEYLADYLAKYKEASEMSAKDLFKRIMAKKGADCDVGCMGEVV